MEQTSRKTTSLAAQSHALMMKNLIIRKRKWKTTILIVIAPALACLFLRAMDTMETGFFKREELMEPPANSAEMQYAKAHPPKFPPLFQIPLPEYRATNGNNISDPNYYPDLPRNACRKRGTCPVTILFTGMNRTVAEILGQSLYGSETLTEPSDSLDLQTMASKFILGTYMPSPDMVIELPDDLPLYVIQQRCKSGLTLRVPMEIYGYTFVKDAECVNGLHLWRKEYADIIRELPDEHSTVKFDKNADEFLGAYDFLNTDEGTFNVTVWYNLTKNAATHVLRATNVASNSYLQNFRGSHVQMLLDFVKDIPKEKASKSILENFINSAMRTLIFLFIIQSLIPIMLNTLVYEKQHKLRLIMKMHGLGDFPYWMIYYAYFFLLYSAYVLCLVISATVVGINIFKLNDASVQFVFFFLFVNAQIAFTMLLSTFFSTVKTSSVIGFIIIFATGISSNRVNFMPTNSSLSRTIGRAVQIIPCFAFSRGLDKLSKYSEEAETLGEICSNWKVVASDKDGLQTSLIIMFIAWPTFLLIGYYLDQVGGSGSGVKKHPLWFLPCFQKRFKRYEQKQDHEILVSLEKPDVSQEREKVQRLLQDSVQSHKIIVDDLKKAYPPRDGNPEKHAVRGLSLAIAEGECFGMLGPNGAGKTSFISMMTGLTTPTSGAAFIEELDIREDMGEVYTRMGVCPQHDLLWELLTGREHLYFYGRLKNFGGAELKRAVEDSLASVNLTAKGNTRVGQYSGGMKRRLSVAISLIGDPKVVYLDEPSTGLDPASRKSLWSAVEKAKKDKAIILTTHSMEEAEFLCDRVGIFVDGSLQCIGHPKELRARYGGYFLLTIVAPFNQGEEVEKLVHDISPNANKVHHISETQKYHLPKQEVTVVDIFRAVKSAKGRIDIQDWSLATATLEDVFIKVANNAGFSS